MSNYILKNGSFIELSDDELMHWKYSRREKVGNKWRYYYDDLEQVPMKKKVDTLAKIIKMRSKIKELSDHNKSVKDQINGSNKKSNASVDDLYKYVSSKKPKVKKRTAAKKNESSSSGKYRHMAIKWLNDYLKNH